MTVFARAATLATMTLALAGLIGISSPGLAQQSGEVRLVPAVAVINGPALAPVPVAAPESAPAAAATITPAIVPADAPATRYATLEEAVAAQPAAASDDDAVRCLAGAIYFESKGEPISGQLAVAQVIINRTKSGRFPGDVCSVVKQPGQFSFVHGGAIPVVDEARGAWRTAAAVARVALAGVWDSPAPQALFFHARAEGVAGRFVRIASIGNHVFYR